MLDDDTRQWLALIHRGGAYAHWWVAEGRRSTWWECGAPLPLPNKRGMNVYVCVHPTTQIPTQNRRGEPIERQFARSQVAIVAALSCLYAEFDAKDYGSKEAALVHVDTLEPAPSCIIDSGGGYHAYWLLDAPHRLDDTNRADAAAISAAWVRLVGGDSSVHDLARVLRVPGTRNYKYDPPRPVAWVRAAFDVRYRWNDLAALAAPFVVSAPQAAPPPAPAGDTSPRVEGLLADAIRKVSAAGDGRRHDIALRCAVTLGGVAALDDDRIVRALLGALGPGVKDAGDLERTIRDGVAYGRARPWDLARDRPDWTRAPHAANGTAGHAPPKPPTMNLVTFPTPMPADALARKDIPPSRFFIPEMLRAGLALFIGNPGVGKTPALIQLALAFATGGKWLGAITCPACRVLYIGVEYDEAYIRELLVASYGSADLPADLMILSMETFTPPATEAESLEMLEFFVTALRIEVIVIDTFSGFLPREKFKQDKYRGDYAEFLAYQRLMMRQRALLVGAWHGGKYNKDPETAYNGGQGMWGSAGGGRITMMRSDEDQQVRLRSQLRGYDRREWTLAQAHVGNAHFWSLVDVDPDPIFGSDAQRRIYLAVKTHSSPAEPLTPAGVRGILAQDAPELGIKEPYVRQTLGRLVERGLLSRVGGGYIVKRADAPWIGVDRVDRQSHMDRVDRLDRPGSDPETDPTDPTPIHVPIQPESHSDALIAGRSNRSTTFQESARDPLFGSLPASEQTTLRLYLRSTNEHNQARARELCAEHGIDYAAALVAARQGG